MSHRWGITIPVGGAALAEHAELVTALPDWGYTDLWSSEVAGEDAFTPLALASVWQPQLRLGTAVVPVYTRGPALIAQSAATLAGIAPGRFVLGLGASSPVIVQNWNAIAFEEPFRRTRDVLRFVRRALAGERVDGRFDTFTVSRFALESPPAQPPPVMLAALRPRMLALAGAEADGVILNWLAAGDVPACVREVASPGVEVVARIFVCPTEDVAQARAIGKRAIAAYLTVPAYAAFHAWLGRGAELGPMWQAWQAGDRRGAVAAVPDEVADALVLHGSPESCREQVRAYADAGAHTPLLALLPPSELADPKRLADAVRRMGPG